MCHTELVGYKHCGHTVREFKLCPNQDPRYAKETIYLEPCGISVLTDVFRRGECPRCAEARPSPRVDTDYLRSRPIYYSDDDKEVPAIPQPFKEIDYQRSSPKKEERLSPRSCSTHDSLADDQGNLATAANQASDKVQSEENNLENAITAYREECRSRRGVLNWHIVSCRPPPATSLQQDFLDGLDAVQRPLQWQYLNRLGHLKQDSPEGLPQYLPWSLCPERHLKLNLPSERYALPTLPGLGESAQSKCWHLSAPHASEDSQPELRNFFPRSKFVDNHDCGRILRAPGAVYCKHGTQRELSKEYGQYLEANYHKHMVGNGGEQFQRKKAPCGPKQKMAGGKTAGGPGGGTGGKTGGEALEETRVKNRGRSLLGRIWSYVLLGH